MKVAKIHDMYMVVSGVSVCEEVHPCRVNIIYSNSRVRGKDYWVAYTVHRQVKVDSLKCAR